MRNDVHILSPSLLRDIISQLLGTVFDRRRGRDGAGYDMDAIGGESLFYAAPVVDAWEEGAGEVEFVEAEEAVGEDDGV